MSAYLQLNWQSATLPSLSSAGSLEDAINLIAKDLPKDKPLVMFFGSWKKIKKRKKMYNTRQAINSAKLSNAFNDKNFKVQLALKYCYYYNFDVTNVTEEQSPFICHEKAPLLVVYYDGKIIKTLKTGSSKLIFMTIGDALKQCNFDVFDLTEKIKSPIRKLFNIEKDLYDFNQKYIKQVARKKKKNTKSMKTKIAKFEEEKEELYDKKEAYKKEIEKIAKEYTGRGI